MGFYDSLFENWNVSSLATTTLHDKDDEIKGSAEKLLKNSKVSMFSKVLSQHGEPHVAKKKKAQAFNRWIRLSVYCLALGVNNMLWLNFSAIAPQLEERYGLSSWAVTWFSLIFMIAYPIGAFPAAWTSEYNTTIPVLICAGLGALGAVIRCFATTPDLYWLLYLGQIFPALGQPFGIALPPKITSRWFKPEEREVACTIGCLAPPVGIIMAFIIAPVFDLPNETNFFWNNQFIQAVVAVLAFVLVGLIYRDPEHDQPPADDMGPEQYAALAQSLGLPLMQMGPVPARDGIRYCFKSRSIILLILMFGVSQGSFLTIGTIINDLLPGYSQDAKSMFAAMLILGGLVGSAITVPLLRRTKAHKKIIVVSMSVGTALIAVMIASMPYGIVPVYATACFFLGLFVFPTMMVSYELSVEMTFLRADESLVATLSQVVTQALAITQILIMTPMLEYGAVNSAWIIILLSFAAAVVGTFFIEAQTLRLDAERAGITL